MIRHKIVITEITSDKNIPERKTTRDLFAVDIPLNIDIAALVLKIVNLLWGAK